MNDVIWILSGQAVAALFTAVCLVRYVLPRLREEEGAETAEMALTGDVWIPLALSLPLILLAPAVGPSLGGAGWAPVGAPVVLGWIIAGAAMAAIDRGGGLVRSGESAGSRGMALALWGLGGVLLLLLGAAHELTLLTGQMFFAMGAVLLWWLSGAPGTVAVGGEGRGAVRAGLGLLGALLGAACCAVLGLRAASSGYEQPAIMIALLPGVLTAAPLAIFAGRGRAIRIGGWTALIGLWIGTGAISLSRLLPLAFNPQRSLDGPIGTGVAFGFGRYAPEAVMLLLLAGIALLANRLVRPLRVVVAALMVVAGAVILTIRILHVG